MSNKRKASELDEKYDPNGETYGHYTKIVPEESMTYVTKPMTRLCASVSGQIYAAENKEDFKLSTDEIIAKAIHYENHGDPFGNVTPPMAVVISGNIMILGWQGSTTISDGITDFHLVPVSSSRWAERSTEVKAHGGFLSVIENDLTCQESFLIKKMEEHKITEVITTGHSLGGGMAQVAHLCIQGELSNPNSAWSRYQEKVPNFIVRSLAFSAPMSISTASSVKEDTTKFLHEVASRSVNIIFSMDIVPRGFSELEFIHAVIKDVIDDVNIPDVLKELNVSIPGAGLVSRFIGAEKQIKDGFENLIQKDSVQNITSVCKTYRHYGNIIYYESDAAKPMLVRDYNHEPKITIKKFNDLKYSNKLSGSFDIIRYLTNDHLQTVRGPGLAYEIPQKSLAGKTYMLDGFEILEGYHDVKHLDFNGKEDLIKKLKENMYLASYAAVAVWDNKNIATEDKFKDGAKGTLYFKDYVPGKSDDAKVDGGSWFGRSDTKHKATFWRTPALNDWVNSYTSINSDKLPGIIELKKK